jgi:crossover junction endodeoxyribonuclease RuvC
MPRAQGAVVVLGLDPGSRATGYGLVAETSGSLSLVAAGVIRGTSAEPMAERLFRIFSRLSELIAAHRPEVAAVEDVFVSANARSALILGQARGAALTACAAGGVPVEAYEPTYVKKSIVGVGRAEKSQVAFMVGRLLGEAKPLAVDASDALAVAICHLNERRFKRLAGIA